MSATPTVGQLITAATEQLVTLTEAMAKAFIKNNNIRSMGKLKTLVGELAAKTPEEITAACTPVEGTVKTAPKVDAKKPETKPEPKKAETKPAEPKAAKKADGEDKPKFERQGRAKRTTAVTAGPRGFRFGEVWTNSVIAGEGIAMLEIHRNKLIAHAESVGVHAATIQAGDVAKIAKAIAHKLETAPAPAAE